MNVMFVQVEKVFIYFCACICSYILLIYSQILKGSLRQSKVQTDEDDEYTEEDQVALYGKWQTEKLCLPRAVDGIVPKVKFYNYYLLMLLSMNII